MITLYALLARGASTFILVGGLAARGQTAV
jgi:hypothetical protein